MMTTMNESKEIWKTIEEYPMLHLIRNTIKLMFAWAVTDTALQTRSLALHKSPLFAHPSGEIMWPMVLSCHGLINGCGVWLVTGSVTFGLIETVTHCMIDYMTCIHWINHSVDIPLHFAVKILIAWLWVNKTKKEAICQR